MSPKSQGYVECRLAADFNPSARNFGATLCDRLGIANDP